MHVELETYSLSAGQNLGVLVTASPSVEIGHLQIDVSRVGASNPAWVAGVAAQRIEAGRYVAAVPTAHLRNGFYEIRCIQHGASSVGAELRLSSPLSQRCIFEINDTPRAVSAAGLLLELVEVEREIEREFLKPVHATLGVAKPVGVSHAAFVFVRGILLGTRLRFQQFEIVPVRDGLESKDALECVNAFLREQTSTGVAFPYADDVARQSQQANPVSVFYFPAVIAHEPSEVRLYAESCTELAILALALTRDASGAIFDIVVFNHHTSCAVKYARTEHYVGNLLTGFISGENPDVIGKLIGQLQLSQFDRFLVSLYRQAIREPAPDFQYVRLFQIMEIMAEAQNYDSSMPLLDYEGHQVVENGKLHQTHGSANIVFALLRDSGIGASQSTWKNVNVWFAFRSAVAHHGSMANCTKLSRQHVRRWAVDAWAEIRTVGHDAYLWKLKEDVKSLLIRKLTDVVP